MHFWIEIKNLTSRFAIYHRRENESKSNNSLSYLSTINFDWRVETLKSNCKKKKIRRYVLDDIFPKKTYIKALS